MFIVKRVNKLKKIIILGASELQVPAIKKAKEMGLYVISVDFDEKAVGFQYCDKKYIISTLDKEAVLKIARDEQISGIMTLASDLPMRTVAYVSNKLDLPGISEETSEIVTNKYKMRNIFAENNIQTIQYKLITNFSEFKEFKKKVNRDMVLKPISSSGSRGISYVNKDDTEEELLNSFKYSLQYSKTDELIAEEFFEGNEISVESITSCGHTKIIQITDKITTNKPYFVEIGHSQPANIKLETKKEIEKLVEKTIKAVGMENGPAHTEIIIGSTGELNVVEIGARLGGDYITTDLVPLSTGVNMVEQVIKLSIGDPVDIKASKNSGSAIKFFRFDSGVVKKISGINTINKLVDIKAFDLKLNVGDVVNEIKNSTSRYGCVISKGKNADEALKNCDQAINLLKIEFD